MAGYIYRLFSLLVLFFCLAVVSVAQQPQYPYAVDTKPTRGLMPNSEQLERFAG